MKTRPAQIRDADDFSERFGAVKSGGKWGYVNRKGALAIMPEFDDAAPSQEVSIRKVSTGARSELPRSPS